MRAIRRISLLCAAILIALALPSAAQDFHALAAGISQHIAASGRKSVGVIDFTNLDGNPTELGRYLAEEFSDALFAEAKSFEVIDRTHLKAILQEHKLAASGLIDPATSKLLGQFAGVDTLVTGTITPFEEHVHVSLKVLDVETLRILAADTIDVPRTQTISDLLGVSAGNTNAAPAQQKTGESPAESPTPGTKFAQPSMEVQGIRALADNCRANGQILICTLTLTSQQQDVKIRLGAGAKSFGRWVHSEAYDDSGVEYGSDAITFAGKTSYPFAEFEGLLVSDVPTHLLLKFNQFSGSSAKVTLLSFRLEVWPASGGYRQSDFALRNIPIQRQ